MVIHVVFNSTKISYNGSYILLLQVNKKNSLAFVIEFLLTSILAQLQIQQYNDKKKKLLTIRKETLNNTVWNVTYLRDLHLLRIVQLKILLSWNKSQYTYN